MASPWVAGAATALVIVAAVTACSAGPAVSPGPGDLVRSWTYRGETAGAMQAIYYAAQPHLLIASVQGTGTGTVAASAAAIIALNPATGREKWLTYTGNDQAIAVGATQNSIVSYTTSPAGLQSGGSFGLWAFATSTGNELWSKSLQASDVIAGMSGNNVVVIQGRSLVQFSASSGAKVRSEELPVGCSGDSTNPGSASADNKIIALALNCTDGTVRLVVYDAATETQAWARAIVSNYRTANFGVTIGLAGRVVAESTNVTTALFGQSGRVLLTVSSAAPQAWVSSDGPDTLLTYETPAGHVVAEAINNEDGRTVRRFTAPYTLSSAAFTGSNAYLTVRLPSPLLPTALAVVNMQSGSHSLSTLPLSLSQNITQSSPLMAGDGLIFEVPSLPSAPGVVTYQAKHGPARPNLQGNYGGPWPPACGLLASAQLAAITGSTYTESQTRIQSTGLPAASECKYTPTRPGAPFVSVSVQWVANTVAAAASIVASASVGLSRVAGIGNQAYVSPGSGSYPYTHSSYAQMVLRQGRLIVGVRIIGAPSARPVACIIAANVRKHFPTLLVNRGERT
jgi:hypothetical protein